MPLIQGIYRIQAIKPSSYTHPLSGLTVQLFPGLEGRDGLSLMLNGPVVPRHQPNLSILRAGGLAVIITLIAMDYILLLLEYFIFAKKHFNFTCTTGSKWKKVKFIHFLPCYFFCFFCFSRHSPSEQCLGALEALGVPLAKRFLLLQRLPGGADLLHENSWVVSSASWLLLDRCRSARRDEEVVAGRGALGLLGLGLGRRDLRLGSR